jgi:hypothetical protein
MRATGRVAASLVFGAIACSGVGAAAQQNLSLPDVTVTAPRVTPPPIAPSAKPNPYFGNARVEEDKWREIPCAASRIGVGAGAICRTGPAQETFQLGSDLLARQQSNCNIAHDLVISNIGALAIEADVLVFDPYYVSAIGHQRQDCYVDAGYFDPRENFPDLNQMTRRGNAWRNFIDAAILSQLNFRPAPTIAWPSRSAGRAGAAVISI